MPALEVVDVSDLGDVQAAHHLPRHPGKCKDLHGHTYRFDVLCEGPIDPESGMVVDFADVKAAVRERVLNTLDHKLLNDIIEYPTAEHIAAWIWTQLEGSELPVVEIRLWETTSNYVVYRGEPLS